MTDPVAVITAVVRAVEPHLDAHAIENVITSAVKIKPSRRRLAAVLQADPELLTSGRPQGPFVVQHLITALQAAGARHVVHPRCARCGGQKPLRNLDGELRICAHCAMRRAATAEPCSGCGRTRQITTRDRRGRPQCPQCRPAGGDDAARDLCALIQGMDTGLPTEQIAAAIDEVMARPMHMRQVLWEVEADPTLLTGAGAKASAKTRALIAALAARGGRGIVVPACPKCDRKVRLERQLDGVACCRRCHDDAHRTECSRCGKANVLVGARTPDGSVICHACRRRDPINFEECTRCGRHDTVVRRTEHDRLCARCFRPPTAECSHCGQQRPCHHVRTSTPICEPCSARRRAREACAGCAQLRTVVKRLPDGTPLCQPCAAPRDRCAVCGKHGRVISRTAVGEALCGHCHRSHPDQRRPCRTCATVVNPYRWGLCPSCALARMLRDVLGKDGVIPPAMKPLFTMLTGSEPLPVLWWLRRHTARRTLAALVTSGAPLSHKLLDALEPQQTVAHLRAGLVAAGTLPWRDERPVRLERWIPEHAATITDPADRRTLRAFATWHHLRRLRRDAHARPLTAEQVSVVRRDVRAAVHLLAWLHARRLTLTSARQSHIDRWLDDGGRQNFSARPFVLWAVERGHARDIEVPNPVRDSPMTVIAHDRRWMLVRDLVSRHDLDTATRAIGLLLLLYAQPLTRITKLTVDDVTDADGQVTVAMGAVPTVVPPPLDDLIRQLLVHRHGHSSLGRTQPSPWLLPGGPPGQPIGVHQVIRRLQPLGIRARPSRNTTLIELAAELPAVVLSRLLGLHINSATRWTRQVAATGSQYAADLARRRQPEQPVPG